VDPRAGPDDVEKRKFLTLPGHELPNPGSSSPQSVTIPTTLSQLLYILRNILQHPVALHILTTLPLCNFVDILIYVFTLQRQPDRLLSLFPPFLQAYVRIPYVRQGPRPCTSFPIHCLVIILQSEEIERGWIRGKVATHTGQHEHKTYLWRFSCTSL
jgi:hypothetical protein